MEQSAYEGEGNRENVIGGMGVVGIESEVETDVDREEGSGEVSLGRRFFNLQTLASFAISFAIIYFVISKLNLDFGQIIDGVRQANPAYLTAAFAVFYLSFIVRAWRWGFLLRNVGFHEREGVRLPSMPGLTQIILLSWFANCIVPAKLGDAYRGYLLRARAGVSFSKTLGTVLAERMIDLVVLFVLLVVAGLQVFHGAVPQAFGSMIVAGSALVVLIVACLVAMLRFGHLIKRILPSRLEAFYERFQEGTLLSFQNLPLLLVTTICVWAFEIGRLWFVLFSLGVRDFPTTVVIFIALASSLLTTVPFTPAGLGVVESVLIGLLLLMNGIGTIHGIDPLAAATIATLDRTISYLSLVVVGLLVYLFSKRKGVSEGMRRLYCVSASIIQRR